MPRGTHDTAVADKAMDNSQFAKVTEEPQRFYFEGLGEPQPSRNGKSMETPIFVVSELMNPKELTANANLYRQFREALVKPWELFEISKKLEPMMDDKTGQQMLSRDTNEPMNRNVYTIKPLGKFLSAEQQREVMAKTEDEVDISDIPF